MGTRERILRGLGAAVLVAGLVVGTLFWGDDTWPFAQMRMFPGGRESDIVATGLRGWRSDATVVEMTMRGFHMRRAEIEGQQHRVKRNPAMLRDLIDHYNEGVPPQRRITRLELTRRQAVPASRVRGAVAGAAPAGVSAPPGYVWTEQLIATWPSGSGGQDGPPDTPPADSKP